MAVTNLIFPEFFIWPYSSTLRLSSLHLRLISTRDGILVVGLTRAKTSTAESIPLLRKECS